MSRRSFACLAAVALILSAGAAVAAPVPSPPVAAETPRSLEGLRMFPGLTRVGEEPSLGGGLTDWGTPYPMISGRKLTYATQATAEEVFAFYHQQLGGKVAHDESDDHTHIGPGGATPVILDRDPYEFEDTENPLTNRPIPAASQRALLANNRPPSAQGDWIQEGSFSWVIKDRTGAPTSFHVKVVDRSVRPNWTGYTPRTEVEVYIQQFGLIADDDD